MIKKLFTLTILVLSLTSLPSYALGKMGHQLICQLSYDLLSPSQQNKIDQLLSQLPEQEKQLINKYNYQAKDKPLTFANSCTWADAIKKQKGYEQFKSWHYINVDRQTKKITKSSCKKNCITNAIDYHSRALNTLADSETRAQALMFLGHWLGDIHQPLHVSFASDYGGNRNKIKPIVGPCNSLHWLWDQCLLFKETKSEKVSHDSYNQQNFKRIYQQLLAKLQTAPKDKWKNSSPVQWANESLQLVREEKFGYCKISDNTCVSRSADVITLDSDYWAHYNPILTTRVLQAVVRLQKLLADNV